MDAATSWPETTVCCACAAASASRAIWSDPADRCRGLVAGEQDQRAPAVGVVESSLERGKVAAERVAEPVEHPDPVGDPVGDQVGAVAHQQLQLVDQRGRDLHLGQVAAVSQGLGDDVGIACVGLGLTPVGGRHLVRGAPRHVLDLLAVRGQQRQKKPGHRASDIDRPDHLLGALQDSCDPLEDRALVVDDLHRRQSRTRLRCQRVGAAVAGRAAR